MTVGILLKLHRKDGVVTGRTQVAELSNGKITRANYYDENGIFKYSYKETVDANGNRVMNYYSVMAEGQADSNRFRQDVYNQDGKVAVRTNYNATGAIQNTQEFAYSGNTTTIVNKDATGTILSKQEVVDTEAGKTERTYKYDVTTETYTLTNERTYNAQDQQTGFIKYTNGVATERFEYIAWDSSGRPTAANVYNGQETVVNHTETYAYVYNGLKDTTLTTKYQGGVITDVSLEGQGIVTSSYDKTTGSLLYYAYQMV